MLKKTIRKNQGKVICPECNRPYHLKCLDLEFEANMKCSPWCIKNEDCFEQAGNIEMDLRLFSKIVEAMKLRGLKFVHQNIRSLYGKFDQLQILIAQCSNLHVIALTETWLRGNTVDSEISLPGYALFRNDRNNGSGGGIAIYVKDSL